MEKQILKYISQLNEKQDQRVLRLFYDLCYERFFRIAWYFVRSDQDAQQIVVDLFMKVWEHPEKYLSVKDPLNYFFIIIKNASLLQLEKNKKSDVSLDYVSEFKDQTSRSPEDILIEEENFRKYIEVLDSLPPRCKDVFVKIREENKTYDEVANALNISVYTVSAQLQKALYVFKSKFFLKKM